VEFTDSARCEGSSRVFDPFYTTKPVGKGTAWASAFATGFVIEHGGSIRVKEFASSRREFPH